MLLVLSSIEDAFALSHNLDTSYFDKVKNFSENRAKTYLAGRALLQSVLHHFYSIESLPNIKKTEKESLFLTTVLQILVENSLFLTFLIAEKQLVLRFLLTIWGSILSL